MLAWLHFALMTLWMEQNNNDDGNKFFAPVRHLMATGNWQLATTSTQYYNTPIILFPATQGHR